MRIFGDPVLGGLSDRIGRRPVLLMCLLDTALSIGLWVLFGARSPIGYLDKAIEVPLIVVLAICLRRRLV
jgi:MFS family permease